MNGQIGNGQPGIIGQRNKQHIRIGAVEEIRVFDNHGRALFIWLLWQGVAPIDNNDLSRVEVSHADGAGRDDPQSA